MNDSHPPLDRRAVVLPRSHRGDLGIELMQARSRSPLQIMASVVKWTLILLGALYLGGFVLYAALLQLA